MSKREISSPGPQPPRREAAEETVPQFAATFSIPRIELFVEREGGAECKRSAVVDGDFIRIGSHASNELVLNDPMVSRFHCELSCDSRGWKLKDSGSLNGTRVNGTRTRDADIEPPNCRIELGTSVIWVREFGTAGDAVLPAIPSFGGLYGSSVAMRRLYDLIRRVAKGNTDVLLEGESGTGKELITREIVQRSSRAGKPFVVVDCGAISPSLIESELFGHLRGAFTGADRNRVGAFEEADGGTLFLDEIGELPLEMQPKLLRAIAEREVRRIGENNRRKVDVRVIAATNRKLEREINQGRFREDLYFRLSVVTLRVPPLRDRLEDIPILVRSFLDALGAADKADLFTPEVLEDMKRYDWPGNVRELRNYVERRVVLGVYEPQAENRAAKGGAASNSMGMADGEAIDLDVPFKKAKDTLIEGFEKRYLTALLEWSEGNVSRAARKASMDRVYLHRLLHHYGMRRGSSLSD